MYGLEVFCAHPLLSNKPYDVVRSLWKGHHPYIDNYYCQSRICRDLAERDTKEKLCGHAT